MFGAYFGIAVSRAFRSPKPFSLDNSKSNAVSDVLSLLGTGLLWVYWPSFVGATETASPANENHCVIHTILALLGSTSATFFLSHKIVGKFDPFHIANSTLAGGVAVGASARLDMTPGGALLLGVIAGTVSVLGFVYVSPMLEARLSTYDSCGVHNLHGLPSVIGGLASAVFVTLDSGAEFLEYGKGQQAFRQILAVVCTIAFALVSGWATGVVLVKADQDTPAEYYDGAWWESEYLDEVDFADDDKSHHSRGSILPVMIGQVGEP
jgi:ammonium transporter Rh